MKRAMIVLAVLALVAFAGDMTTGGAELTKFKGYGTFRWTSYGVEDNAIGNSFSDYVWMAWLPKINENVDFCVSFAHTTTASDPNVDFDQIFLNLNLNENFSVRGGQFKVPFGYAYTRYSGSMYFADRSFVTNGGNFTQYGGRDIGAMVTAEFQPVTVDLMISNGKGNNALADTLRNKQITARVAADPSEWLTIGASVAMIGEAEDGDDDEWSGNGIDAYAVVEYPVSPTGTFLFTGEYMMLGYDDAEDEGMEIHDGTRMSVMAGYRADLDGDVLLSITPAVRYDMNDPISEWAVGTDEPEDNITCIDFALNMDLFSKYNTLQLGARNYGFEAEGQDGHTDIYANWRINF